MGSLLCEGDTSFANAIRPKYHILFLGDWLVLSAFSVPTFRGSLRGSGAGDWRQGFMALFLERKSFLLWTSRCLFACDFWRPLLLKVSSELSKSEALYCPSSCRTIRNDAYLDSDRSIYLVYNNLFSGN